jgi:hypothetical protein
MTSIHPASLREGQYSPLPKDCFMPSALRAVMTTLVLISTPSFASVEKPPKKLGGRIQRCFPPVSFERVDMNAERIIMPQREVIKRVKKQPLLGKEKVKPNFLHSIHYNDEKFRVVKFISSKVSCQEDRDEKKNVVKVLKKPGKIEKFKTSKKVRQLSIQKERDLKFLDRL